MAHFDPFFCRDTKWRPTRSSATVNGRVAKPRPTAPCSGTGSPIISIHVAGLEKSRDLWNELEERYRRMELSTFCELFAQLRETAGERCGSTREFVDRVRLLVHRLNAISPG
jgi:hypothetical protein